LSLAVVSSLTAGQGLRAEDVPHVAATTPVQASDAGPRRLDIEAAPAQPVAPPVDESLSDREVIEERYPSGALKLRREVSQDAEGNYHNNGAWIQYDERGSVLTAGEYRHGRRQGTWEHQYGSEEGKLFADAASQGFQGPLVTGATFDNGVLHGKWSVVDAQDRTICEWEFADGERHGKSVWYASTGRKKREANFSHGQLDGGVIDYDNSGKVIATHKYVSGGKLVKVEEFHAPGKRKSLGAHFEPQSTYTSYDWSPAQRDSCPPSRRKSSRPGRGPTGTPPARSTWTAPTSKISPTARSPGGTPMARSSSLAATRTECPWANSPGGMPTPEANGNQLCRRRVERTLGRWDKNGKILEKGDYAAGVSPLSEDPEAISEESRLDAPAPDDAERFDADDAPGAEVSRPSGKTVGQACLSAKSAVLGRQECLPHAATILQG